MKEEPKFRPKHPCSKECPERTVECKRTCEAWKQYEAEKMEDYKHRAEVSDTIGAVIQMERGHWKRRCTLASYKYTRN